MSLRLDGRMIAALLTGVLLFVPVVLAGYPQFTRAQFPGPFTRIDAIVVFFVAVPLVFTALAAYRVAQYHGVGVANDRQ